MISFNPARQFKLGNFFRRAILPIAMFLALTALLWTPVARAAVLLGPPIYDLQWGSFGTAPGQFQWPTGAVVDSSGDIYVVDQVNHRIQKFDGDGNFLFEWGSVGTADGQFSNPQGAALDTAGNIYIADQSNHRIQKFDSNGNFLLKWGTNGTAAGEFRNPVSVDVDSSGRVYVADLVNNRVQVFDTDGLYLFEFGSIGTGDGQFRNPLAVAVDNLGNVYVADGSNQRVQKFDSDGNFLLKWGAVGTDDGEFRNLKGVSADAQGLVYISDAGNNRVQVFDDGGDFVLSWGTPGIGNGEFSNNFDVAIGEAGNGSYYVVDRDNHRIQKFVGPPDTEAPTLILPPDAVVEATSAAGAVFTYTVDVFDEADPNPSLACNPASGSLFPMGLTTVDCAAMDASGNSSQGSFTVTVMDTTPPTINLPADVTLEATGPSGASYSYTASASDAVDPSPSLNCSPASGSDFPLGVNTVSCASLDAAGNLAQAAFTVTVLDSTDPTLVLPADVVLEATGPAGASYSFTATALDLADPSPTVTCSPASGSTFPLGTTTVNCTATDNSGNSDQGGFTVTVEDTTPPTLNLPADDTVEATSASGVDYTYSAGASDIVDTSPTLSCNPASGSLFPLGDTVIDCTATDFSGNAASGSFIVSVVDTTAPGLNLPADVTLEATGASGADYTYSASASDAVDPSPSLACSPASGSTFPLGDTTVDCTATDSAGNSSSGGFTITVEDTTPPTLNLPGNETLQASNPAGVVHTYSASASDLVDSAPTLTCTPASGSTFAPGTTTVDCSATDASGNSASGSFDVTVLPDSIPPTLNLPGNVTVEATGPSGANYSYTVSASDDLDPSPTLVCTPPAGSLFPLGTTTVDCAAVDSYGNSTTGSFDVTVVDSTPPTLNLPGDASIEVSDPSGTIYTYSASASDIVDPSPTLSCSPASGSIFPLGDTTVDCTATDSAGNSSTGSFTVSVNLEADTTPPTLYLPADVTIPANSEGAYYEYVVSASDDRDPSPTVVCDPPSGTYFPVGMTTVECTATDASGNSSTGSFTVTVEPHEPEDTTAPEMDLPADVVIEAESDDGAVYEFEVGVTDDMDPEPSVVCEPPSGSLFPIGETIVECTATDNAGNTSTGGFSVTVNMEADTSPPTLHLPEDVTIPAMSDGAVYEYEVSASDDRDPAPSVICEPPSGTYFLVGTTTVECTATDASGNSSTGSFTVTVEPNEPEDTTAPEMDLPADVVIEAESDDGAVYEYEVDVKDDLDPEPTVVCEPPSGSLFPIGETTVDCTATDNAGNSSSGSFTVTVEPNEPEDTTAPEMDLPADVVIEAESDDGAVYEYEVDVKDDLDPEPTVVCEPPSGTYFLVGMTTVECTATDNAGNSSSGSFTVTVKAQEPEDTTAPDVKAGFIPLGKITEDEGKFRIEYTCTDVIDPDPTITSSALNGIPVTDRPLVDLNLTDGEEKHEWDGRVLRMWAPSFELVVTCEDAAGNVGTATAAPEFAPPDDDEYDTTPPEVEAKFKPIWYVTEKRGTFIVRYSCSDDMDRHPSIVSAKLNGVPVRNGQWVKLFLTDGDHEGKFYGWWLLWMWGSEFELEVTCEDAAGHSTTVTAEPTFASPDWDGDDDGDDNEGDDNGNDGQDGDDHGDDKDEDGDDHGDDDDDEDDEGNGGRRPRWKRHWIWNCR